MTSITLNKSKSSQIAFRYRATDSATGITRETAKRLAERLGVDETQAIHIALHNLAVRMLPQYEMDDGALTAAQFDQIKQQVPQAKNSSVRTQLIELKAA
jgi:hypothetical protein